MNRTNRIRIFYAVTAIAAVLSCYLGYQMAMDLKQTKEQNRLTAVADTEQERNEEAVTEAEVNQLIPSYEYIVVSEEGYLTVYKRDLSAVYMYTDIRMDELSIELQKEIELGKLFEDIGDLYNFLENYSS